MHANAHLFLLTAVLPKMISFIKKSWVMKHSVIFYIIFGDLLLAGERGGGITVLGVYFISVCVGPHRSPWAFMTFTQYSHTYRVFVVIGAVVVLVVAGGLTFKVQNTMYHTYICIYIHIHTYLGFFVTVQRGHELCSLINDRS